MRLIKPAFRHTPTAPPESPPDSPEALCYQTALPSSTPPRRSPLRARTAAFLHRLRSQQPALAAAAVPCAAVAAAPVHTSADSDLNRVHLTGTLGSEPMLYTIGDHPVADLALACRRCWPTATGADEVETTWINLRAWEEIAEQCGRLLHSGDRVYVEGSLHLWNARSARQSHPCHTIVIDRIVLLTAGAPHATR